MAALYDLKRSELLTNIIRQEIENQGGSIPFNRFMSLALYHPLHGYYCSDRFSIGREGDFTTASEISSLYASCFARQYQPLSNSLPEAQVLELGAGSGRFAGDLLTALDALHCLPERYWIYEISPILRQKQQAFLQTHFPQYYSRITWLEAMPEGFKGMMIANEVLDALPVTCFRINDNDISERQVGWLDNQFAWVYSPAKPPLSDLVMSLKNDYALSQGYESELCLELNSFMHDIAHSLEAGMILFADYGYGQREYYHPQRNRGTLTCFYQHRHHDNPFMLPGLQDITSHVDFSRVAEAASALDLTLLGYTTQAAFLLACGLLDQASELEAGMNDIEQFELHQTIKTLTLPTEMGERIKIMGLGKNIAWAPLRGFSMQDRRREL